MGIFIAPSSGPNSRAQSHRNTIQANYKVGPGLLNQSHPNTFPFIGAEQSSVRKSRTGSRKLVRMVHFQSNVDIGDLEILYFTSGHDSAVHNKVR